MPQANNIIFLMFITLIVYALLSCAAGITGFRQILVLRKGVQSQRTLYKKRAIQSLELSLVINVILLLASVVDVTIAKAVFANVGAELNFITNFFPGFVFFTVVFLFLWIRALKKSEDIKVFWPFALLTAFTSLKAMSIVLIIVFRLFYTPVAEVLPFIAIVEGSSFSWLFTFYNKLFSVMLPFVQFPLASSFIVLFFLFAGAALGSALQMVYTLLCRRIDDFGRDYYAQTLRVLSSAGFRVCLVLTILLVLPILMNLLGLPVISFVIDSTALMLLCIPLALVNFIIVALNENPLRFKISISTSPIFVLVGVFFFIVQTLVPLTPAVEAVTK